MMGPMSDSETSYELLDFGDGRKLERFGTVVLNRPCPAAEGVEKSRPELWDTITARFRGPRTGDGSWTPQPKTWMPEEWCFALEVDAPFRLKLEALPSGQVGVFPEQRGNWEWIARQLAKPQAMLGRALKVLNLFAYTGGSTLAAAAAGAEVVHIDAAQNIVDRARENAAFSGLAERPIRWIAEDAMKFCRRELKRGKQYDAVILDPPKFADARRHLDAALRGYKDINLLALKLLRPGGLLISFSCSGLVGRDLFQKAIADAAVDAGRHLRILHWLDQASDHAVAVTFPEGSYLKGIVGRVE